MHSLYNQWILEGILSWLEGGEGRSYHGDPHTDKEDWIKYHISVHLTFHPGNELKDSLIQGELGFLQPEEKARGFLSGFVFGKYWGFKDQAIQCLDKAVWGALIQSKAWSAPPSTLELPSFWFNLIEPYGTPHKKGDLTMKVFFEKIKEYKNNKLFKGIKVLKIAPEAQPRVLSHPDIGRYINLDLPNYPGVKG